LRSFFPAGGNPTAKQKAARRDNAKASGRVWNDEALGFTAIGVSSASKGLLL